MISKQNSVRCRLVPGKTVLKDGTDDQCLRKPRPGGALMYYKFLDSADIDKVIVNGTLMVSSFEFFRKLEASQWGAIADPLDAASELTVGGPFVIRENSPELETVNKANIGLGMFQKFANVSGGGTIDISGARFVHTIPNLFIFSAAVGELNELTTEMCVNAERRYDACRARARPPVRNSRQAPAPLASQTSPRRQRPSACRSVRTSSKPPMPISFCGNWLVLNAALPSRRGSLLFFSPVRRPQNSTVRRTKV
jgi:hypothetical protein